MATTALISRLFTFPVDPDTAGYPYNAGEQDVFLFDSTIRESHAFSIAITKNPVETGVSMADHAYANPDSLTMEVVVSDTPLLVDGKGTPAVQLAKTQGLQFIGEERRSVNAWQKILDKAKSFAVFEVQTGLRLYRNMMFESGSVEQKVDSAGVMRATIQLTQVQFAGTSTVTYPARGPTKTKKQAATKKDLGKKDAETTAGATKAKATSIAAQLLGVGA